MAWLAMGLVGEVGCGDDLDPCSPPSALSNAGNVWVLAESPTSCRFAMQEVSNADGKVQFGALVTRSFRWDGRLVEAETSSWSGARYAPSGTLLYLQSSGGASDLATGRDHLLPSTPYGVLADGRVVYYGDGLAGPLP